MSLRNVLNFNTLKLTEYILFHLYKYILKVNNVNIYLLNILPTKRGVLHRDDSPYTVSQRPNKGITMDSEKDTVEPQEEQPRPLTSKQAQFAKLVADGAKYSDAYREAYNTKISASSKSINVAASRLAKHPRVSVRIQELKDGDLAATLDNDKITQRWIMERLQAEATNPKNSPSVRVRALELIGKNQKMFGDDSIVVVKERSSEDITKEIQSKLASLLGHN